MYRFSTKGIRSKRIHIEANGLRMKKCSAPTLVMAAEKDCLFPGKGVLKRATD